LLRRFFTRRGVRLLWYALLVLWVAQLFDSLQPILSSASIGSGLDSAEWGSLIFGLLASLIYLFVARLVFEAAVVILFGSEK
jgi:hypothetical protein